MKTRINWRKVWKEYKKQCDSAELSSGWESSLSGFNKELIQHLVKTANTEERKKGLGIDYQKVYAEMNRWDPECIRNNEEQKIKFRKLIEAQLKAKQKQKGKK